jgi:hypothetical protein
VGRPTFDGLKFLTGTQRAESNPTDFSVMSVMMIFCSVVVAAWWFKNYYC